jgi:excisionase family DNA binding protein
MTKTPTTKHGRPTTPKRGPSHARRPPAPELAPRRVSQWRYFTLKEAGGDLRVSPRVVRRMTLTDGLRAIRIGRKYLIREDWLNAYIERKMAEDRDGSRV